VIDLRAEVEQIQADIASERSRTPAPVCDLSNLPADCPACIDHILKSMPPKSEQVNYNKLALNLATYFKARGYKLEGVLGIAKDFIEKYPTSETHDTPQKRRDNFESVWKSIASGNGYKFDCSYILGLKLPGSAFDCKVCAVKRNEQPTTVVEPAQPNPPADRARDIRVINAGTWLETEPPPPDHILEDTLDAGDKMAILASSKLRKSFFFGQLAIALAAHPKFLGWIIPKNRRVLFCQFEIRDHHCHRRIRNMARAMGISAAHLGDRLMIINGRGLGLTGKEGLDKIMAAIGDFKPEVIMIDPLYKFSEGVENAAEDFKKLLNAFDELAEQTGAAIIYVHHDTKGSPGDKDIRDRGAGSNVLGRDYDACVTLTAHASDPDATVVEVLLRNYKPQSMFTIVWSCDEVPGGYRFNMAEDILPFKRTSRTKPAPLALSTYLSAAADVLVGKNKLEIGFFRSAFKEKTGLSDIRIRDFIAWATGDKNPPMRTLEERGKGIHRKWIFMSEAN
jgi:hypothetical protein